MLWVIILWILNLWEWLRNPTRVKPLKDFYYFTNKDVTAFFYNHRRCVEMSRVNNHKYLIMQDSPLILSANLTMKNGCYEASDSELQTVITIVKGRLLVNMHFPTTQLNDEELCILSDIIGFEIVGCELEIC